MKKLKEKFNYACKHHAIFMVVSIYMMFLITSFFIQDYNTFRTIILVLYTILWCIHFLKYRVDRYILRKNDIFNCSIDNVIKDISNHNFDDYLTMKVVIRQASSIKNFFKYKEIINEKIFELIDKNQFENYYDDVRKYKFKVIENL